MSSYILQLALAYRDLLRSETPLELARSILGGSGSREGNGAVLPGLDDINRLTDHKASAASNANPDALALIELARQLLASQPGEGLQRQIFDAGLVPGLASPAKAAFTLDLSDILAQIVGGTSTLVKTPGDEGPNEDVTSGPGGGDRPSKEANAAAHSVAQGSAENTFGLSPTPPRVSAAETLAEQSVAFPDPGFVSDVPWLDRSEAGGTVSQAEEDILREALQAEEFWELLEMAASSSAQETGLLSLVILNAAMIPGWPHERPNQNSVGKPAPASDKQAPEQEDISDEEMMTYLAKLGLHPALLETLKKQISSNGFSRKMMMWLTGMVAVIGLVIETLRREAEEIVPENQRLACSFVGPEATSAEKDGAGGNCDAPARKSRDRIYLD